MSDVVIRVENMSKCYRIGLKEEFSRTPLGVIANFMLKPLKNFRDLRYTARLEQNGQTSDDLIWALNDVSFEVKQGEVIGIIGRNGAGKSTLLKVLARIIKPTSGRAVIEGRLGSMIEVGTGFHPDLTGRENIYMNGAIIGMSRAEIDRKFDEIVAFSGVKKFIDTPVKRYSSGMYVRLAFAVAAHLEPDILIVDEVLAVGDIEFQKKCMGKMAEVSKGGRTVLLVSHSMGNITNLCQRALLLNNGQVAAIGKTASVVQQYLGMVRTAGGEMVWPDMAHAPGDDIARLHAVRILQTGRSGPSTDVTISEDIHVAISYWNLQEGTHLYVSIWLRDELGSIAFVSSNLKSVSKTEDAFGGKPHNPGMFETVCCIPANFLNTGTYSVSVILARGKADVQVFQDYAVSFHVHDSGQISQEYFGGEFGIIRPHLAWQTQFIDPLPEATI